MIHRRGFIGGLIGLVARTIAGAATSLMPVRALKPLTVEELLKLRINAAYELARQNINNTLYDDLVAVTRNAFVPRLFV